MEDFLEGRSPKRKRLSYACNYCRLKKTRCDEQQPSCQNCTRAGVECITTDKRRAGAIVSSRRRASALPETSPHLANSIRSSEPEPEPEPEPESEPIQVSSYVPTSYDQNLLPSAPPSWKRRWVKTERLPMMPRFLGSSMFGVMTGWLELAFYRLKAPKDFDIPRGVSHYSKSWLPVGVPSFPPAKEARDYCRLYQKTLHPLFPILSKKTFEDVSELVCPSVDTLNKQENVENPPLQALSYLVLTVGLKTMGEPAYSREELAFSYISYCNTLLGRLVAYRCLKSVQAILLFAIIIRSCDQITWAWDVLTMGVSMAQSLGINESGYGMNDENHAASEDEDEKRQTWWCMYVFEKILALECGHVSTVWDRELSAVNLTSMRSDSQLSDQETYRVAAVSLANVLHELQERSARTWHREEWLPQTVEEAIREKITTGGDLGLLLQGWRDSLPSALLPGYGSAALRQQSSFLIFYYYYAILLSKRSTLLIDRQELQEKIDQHGRGKPWHSLVSNTVVLIVETAREMIKLFASLVSNGHPDFLMTLTSPLVATYTLAVHVCREPNSLMSKSDYELMKVGMELTIRHYQGHSTIEEISIFMQSLERYTMQRLSRARDIFSTADGQSFVSPSATVPSIAMDEPALDMSLLDPSSVTASSVPPEEWNSAPLDWLGWDWNDLSHLFLRGE